MEENKGNPILKPNPWAAILCYVIILFLVAGFITIFIAGFAANKYGVDIEELLEFISISDFTEEQFKSFVDNKPNLVRASAVAQGWGNCLGYLLATFLVVFFLRDSLKNDFNDLKEKRKFYLWYIPVTMVGAYVISVIVESLVGLVARDSANQFTIEMILKYGGLLPMIFATVLFAPVVEELIYRKSIFRLCNDNSKKGIILSYALSIILFTLPHVLTSNKENIGIWLLQCVPYALSGFLLSLIYHKSNYNIYTSIAAHMFNNLVAVIMVVATL